MAVANWGCPIGLYAKSNVAVKNVEIYNKVKVYFTIKKNFPTTSWNNNAPVYTAIIKHVISTLTTA